MSFGALRWTNIRRLHQMSEKYNEHNTPNNCTYTRLPSHRQQFKSLGNEEAKNLRLNCHWRRVSFYSEVIWVYRAPQRQWSSDNYPCFEPSPAIALNSTPACRVYKLSPSSEVIYLWTRRKEPLPSLGRVLKQVVLKRSASAQLWAEESTHNSGFDIAEQEDCFPFLLFSPKHFFLSVGCLILLPAWVCVCAVNCFVDCEARVSQETYLCFDGSLALCQHGLP